MITINHQRQVGQGLQRIAVVMRKRRNLLSVRCIRTGILLPFFCLLIGLASQTLASETDRVAFWSFGSEDATPLNLNGDVQRDQAGPRPPEFPDFPDDNTAYRFGGNGFVVVQDPGDDSPFDFDNGQAITLESWVNVEQARPGQLMYVVGKGRSDSPSFARDNQNWALRIAANEGAAQISFLFATSSGSGDSHWHRWTSSSAFGVATGWHHIAIAYRFGEPESIRGWIDGRRTDGVWDMGGETADPPVVDNDSVWIGTSRGGSPSNSFHGLLDEVAIHRAMLDDETIASRFNRTGGIVKWGPQPAIMPELEEVPSGRVLVTVAEGWPNYTRWLNEGESWPPETSRWIGDEFLLPRLPARFDDWGIRTSWKAPLVLRMAADVALPRGEHRILLRARGLGRLWIDGEIVARTSWKHRKQTNLEPIEPIADPPTAGARRHGFAQQEVFGIKRIDQAEGESTCIVRVVLELIVGGPQLRTETSEVCVAFQREQTGPFLVLTPTSRELRLEDASIEPALERIEHSLILHEDEQRRTASAAMDDFWRQRHAVALEAMSSSNGSDPAGSIDEWIAKKIGRSLLQSAEHDVETTAHFHTQVLPILREHCFRCHGEKQQGGLRLNSREHALASGESEIPAVVPGDLEASEVVHRIRSGEMPPTDEGLSEEQIAGIEKWILDGARWPPPPIPEASIVAAPIVDDAAFLRRAYLDVIGLPPSESEARAFLADTSPMKRRQLIDQLLDDDRYADHWVSFWMDLLAENPTLLNASLNSTGPFRWFLHDALRDGKPLDRLVTELILMRGGAHNGGSAGFGLAGENDSPMAEKGHILASSLLGIELQCARCHDSPFHSTTQQDLFSLAAMLERKPTTPPKTSRVPDEFFQQKTRESLIRVSLPLGEAVTPAWPFADATGVEDGPQIDRLMSQPDDSRERLAALITGPHNRRFPRVMANHLWKRLIGAGIVEPVHDWEGREASHPEMLDWLAAELISNQYDAKHVLRLIMNSDLYQRQAIGRNLEAPPELRFFNAPEQRRLTAEQIVDSLFTACGAKMDVEELTFVHDGVHPIDKRLTLGKPGRAWMMASLNNERDRPSLSLPGAQPVADVLQAFGWTGSRQKPISERDLSPNVLQPGILANGTLTMSLSRASRGSALADLAVAAESPESLLDALFLRFLARFPYEEERESMIPALRSGFADRHETVDPDADPAPDEPLPQVTWTNHLVPEANEIQLELQRRVQAGPPTDPRLRDHWREVYEDGIWSLINHSEFVWIP